jgi:hypothetical protein
VGIAPDVVDDEVGVLAASAEERDMRASLAALIARRPDWPRMGAAAHARGREFEATRMAAEHYRLYERLLRRRAAT